MDEATEQLIRDTIALMAHHQREVVSYLGTLNSLLLDVDDAGMIKREAAKLNESLDELHASVSRVADAFPPPPGFGNGRPHRGPSA